MPRTARAVYPGVPYHVTHRGNRRANIYFDDGDRLHYLNLFRESRDSAGLRVLAYCLMPNHVHWILVPERADSLAAGIRRAHGIFAAWQNHRHDWKGHLWAHRFYSTALDDRHLWFAGRYVELNPVRAGLVRDPLDYPWSSARANALGEADGLLDPARPFAREYAEWWNWLGLARGGIGDADDRIRKNTGTGRPTGSEEFVRSLETSLGRTLTGRPKGRPRKPRNPESALLELRISDEK